MTLALFPQADTFPKPVFSIFTRDIARRILSEPQRAIKCMIFAEVLMSSLHSPWNGRKLVLYWCWHLFILERQSVLNCKWKIQPAPLMKDAEAIKPSATTAARQGEPRGNSGWTPTTTATSKGASCRDAGWEHKWRWPQMADVLIKGMVSMSLDSGTFPYMPAKSFQLCLTLWDPVEL